LQADPALARRSLGRAGRRNETMNERIRTRALGRGVTLVEVLIVVAIMSVIAGTVTMVAFPELRKARIRTAAIGADAVREAARMYQEVDLIPDAPACPAVPDLVAARKLDPAKINDPWGTPYRVLCDDDVHGVSDGRDRRPSTPDDVREDVTPADVERISRL
jgi:general secretion pathway protein G